MWRTDIQRQIYSQLRHLYPHYVSLVNLTDVDSTADTPRACPADVVQSFGTCLAANCAAANATATCPGEHCLSVLLPLTTECRLCLLTNLNGISNCAQEPITNYEKSYGLMLISKREFNRSSTEDYILGVSEIRGYYQGFVSRSTLLVQFFHRTTLYILNR